MAQVRVGRDPVVSDEGWTLAVVSLGLSASRRPRPGLFRWLWYAVWGGLPRRFDAWVLFDTTSRTWIARHLLRLVLVAAVPAVVLIVLLPGNLGLRLATALPAAGIAVVSAGAFINESSERRLTKAGYDWGTGEGVRARRRELRDRRRPRPD